jgi:hypothetical protein
MTRNQFKFLILLGTTLCSWQYHAFEAKQLQIYGSTMRSENETDIRLYDQNDDYVGLISLSFKQPKKCYIELLKTNRGYRNAGIGSFLLWLGAQEAKDKRCTKITGSAQPFDSDTRPKNMQDKAYQRDRLVAFYQRQGGQVISKDDKSAYMQFDLAPNVDLAPTQPWSIRGMYNRLHAWLKR